MPLYSVSIEALIMKKIVVILAFLIMPLQAQAAKIHNIPADIALEILRRGNERFATYQMKHPNMTKERREKLLNGQRPFALILTCSDSRIPPEIVFDQGLGDLFVVRNAGDVIDEHVMGSIEYAVHHLGVNLVVVLGHQSCGAIGAAMQKEKEKESPGIESIKEAIDPAVKKCIKDKTYTYDNVIRTHTLMDTEDIMMNKDLSEYAKKHDFKVVPAYYNLSTGRVEFLKAE